MLLLAAFIVVLMLKARKLAQGVTLQSKERCRLP
jgi:hypothetical protein